MDKVSGKLTAYFEEPFWVGIFERIEDGKLSVAKVTFGAEPKDYEVQEIGIGTKSQQALKLQQPFGCSVEFRHLRPVSFCCKPDE